jgi:hypothetical protein
VSCTVGRSHEITDKALALYVYFFGISSVAELIDSDCIAPEAIHGCPQVLCAAVKQGDMTLLHKLLNDGKARYGKLHPGYGAVGFALAARLGKNDMFPKFLDAGVKPNEDPISQNYTDIEFQGKHLHCALVEASRTLFDQRKRRNEFEQVEQLEQNVEQLTEACKRPDVDSPEHETWRTSMFSFCKDAITYRRLDVIVLKGLVSKGVDINWAPIDEGTLLQRATKHPDTLHIAEYLLDIGADPDPQSGSISIFHSHNAPIQNAAEHDSELLERLIRANVDVNTKPAIQYGATALQRAAAAGNFQSLKVLLKAGANVNDLPGKYEGRTAIEGAAEHGRLDMVRYLLEAGADIKGRTNQNHRRTVCRAWREGNRTVVRMIQDWKREKYGPEDCEDVEVILESITDDELTYESAAAKAEVMEWESDETGMAEEWESDVTGMGEKWVREDSRMEN